MKRPRHCDMARRRPSITVPEPEPQAPGNRRDRRQLEQFTSSLRRRVRRHVARATAGTARFAYLDRLAERDSLRALMAERERVTAPEARPAGMPVFRP